MKYNICVKPTANDRCKPKIYSFNLADDREALIVACSLRLSTGKIVAAKKKEMEKHPDGTLEEILEDYDVRDPFIFYVENEDEDYNVFDSGEDPDEYENDDWLDEDNFDDNDY